MARNVQGYAQGSTREFVPSSFSNREDQTPVRVSLRVPTEGDKRDIACLAMDLEPMDGAKEGVAFAAIIDLQRRIVSRFVVSVSNYSVRGQAIATGEELAAYGETEILTEVALEVRRSMILSPEGDGSPLASGAQSSS